jgi:hypothetical protein
MNFLLLALIFLAAVYVTIRYGPGGCLVYVLIPCKMFLHEIPSIELEPFPDPDSSTTISYAVIFAMLVSGKVPRLPWHPFDYFIGAMFFCMCMTSHFNGNFWTIVSTFGNETLTLIVPYYMARQAFADPKYRRHAAYILTVCTLVVGFFALIELRLRPFIYSRTLESLGIVSVFNELVLIRFSLFRAQVSMSHPIDLGNVGVIVACLVLMLNCAAGLKVTRPTVIMALMGCGAMVIGSMSWTGFSMVGAAVGVYIALRYIKGSHWLIIPTLLAFIIGAIALTGYLLNYDYVTARIERGQDQFQGSFLTRIEIIQKSWVFAQMAGPWGWGDTISKDVLDLESVDNSYMLFIMRRGWAYFIVWIGLMLTIGVWGFRMMARAKSATVRIPVAAALAGIFSTFVAMYTVWFGFVYAELWVILLGMTATMSHLILGKPIHATTPMTQAQPSFIKTMPAT